MQISSIAPGNIFYNNEEVIFTTDHSDPGCYKVLDHSGNLIVKNELHSLKEINLGLVGNGYYELSCGSDSCNLSTSFGVISSHDGNTSDRVGVNVAVEWLSLFEHLEELAELLKKIGVRWVRDRVTWGEIQKEPGNYSWEIYDRIVDEFRNHNINIVQVFQDSPLWTHPGQITLLSPEDLRDVYSFCKTAAEFFKGRVNAWEVWNEADSIYWPDLSDRFAGLQKAAYLGFKAGESDVNVLISSFCKGASTFAKNLFKCNVSAYFDSFNYHTYNPIENYSERIESYAGLLNENNCNDKPVWLTEAGIYLKENNGSMSKQDKLHQAEFIPKSIALMLASGIEKYFYFLLPSYVEKGIQFGSLKEDLSPNPSLVVLATCIRLLGNSVYIGKYELQDRKVEIHLFNDGSSEVAIAWSRGSSIVDLNVSAEKLVVINMFGAKIEKRSTDGRCRLLLLPSPVYLYGLSKDKFKNSSPGKVKPDKQPTDQKVIIRSFASNVGMNRESDCYDVTLNDTINFCVEVYNFDEAESRQIDIYLKLYKGWESNFTNWNGILKPMDRRLIEFNVKCTERTNRVVYIKAAGWADGLEIGSSVSSFSVKTHA